MRGRGARGGRERFGGGREGFEGGRKGFEGGKKTLGVNLREWGRKECETVGEAIKACLGGGGCL